MYDHISWLRGELSRSVFGGAWHGPSLLEALAEIGPHDASAVAIPGAHSIRDIALHAVAWMEEVQRRLTGAEPGMPTRGDWPEGTTATAEEWNAVRELVAHTATALDADLSVFPAARLSDYVGQGAMHDAPLGTGVTYIVMLNGVVQHNVYHAGQIVLMARALRR
ncbi:DinB family protein [Gemmatimonas phototrophica]|uniref:DinB-like domain-containing protein n=1 Tax=Gemmatimonas phototrophica TaxID=1379270 RepID=A0A143BLS5_9BACT|nr:DinB family protein [Gemmatimonas phototrophica]AMW06009.1 hypothetical protein GEMMAAP_16870 [Gemmatimonas phototrophica]